MKSPFKPKLPSPAEKSDLWYDNAEAAGYLRVSRNTLASWRWLKSGPPYSKIGRKVIYRMRDLDEWITSQNHAGAT